MDKQKIIILALVVTNVISAIIIIVLLLNQQPISYSNRNSNASDNNTIITTTPSYTPILSPEPSLTESPVPSGETIKNKTISAIITNLEGEKYTITMQIPEDVTYSVEENKSTMYLSKNSTKIMKLSMPYEVYERQGYAAATRIESTISKLFRVTSRKVFGTSRDLNSKITYSTELFTGESCTGEAPGYPTTSPCTLPAANFRQGEFLSIFCKEGYTDICDIAVKQITLTRQ